MVPDDSTQYAQAAWLEIKETFWHAGSGKGSFPQGPGVAYVAHQGPSFAVDPGTGNVTRAVIPLDSGLGTWDDVQHLPTDPAKLAGKVVAADSSSAASGRFYGALDLLRYAPVAAPLRRALIQVMVATPGVTLDPTVTDSRGGSSLRLDLTNGDTVVQVFISRADLQIRETTTVAGQDYLGLKSDPYETPVPGTPRRLMTALPEGTLIERTTYLGRSFTAPPTDLLARSNALGD
jgi:hypothetical protein